MQCRSACVAFASPCCRVDWCDFTRAGVWPTGGDGLAAGWPDKVEQNGGTTAMASLSTLQDKIAVSDYQRVLAGLIVH